MVEGELQRLFHPRTDRWAEHFVIEDGKVLGLSTIGKATVKLLNMNDPDRVELRRWTSEQQNPRSR